MSFGSHTFGAKSEGATGPWPAVVPPEPLELRAGREFLVYLDLNEVGGDGADWQPLAQQTTGRVSMGHDLVDLTTEGDDNCPFRLAVSKHWHLDVDAYADMSSSTWQHLRSRVENQQAVWVKIENPDAPDWEGQTVAENFEYEFPGDGIVAYTVSFSGHSRLGKVTV